MNLLDPSFAAELLSNCRRSAAEIAGSFSRTFGTELELSPGEAAPLAGYTLSDEWSAPGLALVLKAGDEALALVLQESCGLIPSWYAEPDDTGRSKLNTLAQELALLLLPEAAIEEFAAARSVDLSQWLRRADVASEAMHLPLTLSAGNGGGGQAHLVWPLRNAAAVLREATQAKPSGSSAVSTDDDLPAAAARGTAARTTALSAPHFGEGELPPYSRNLLKIRVPVTVTLAEKRQPVSRIVELGPGSIIQFDKSCEELLDLEVGGHKIGVGEAVKVGDKFGLRLTLLTVPEERFLPLKPPRAAP